MKKLILFTTLFFISSLLVNAQTVIPSKGIIQKSRIKLGIVLYSNEPETVWNDKVLTF